MFWDTNIENPSCHSKDLLEMLQAHPAWVHSLMQQLQKVLGQKRIHLFQRLHSAWHFCLSHQQSGLLISRYSNQSCQSFWGLPEPQFWSVVPAFVLFVIIYQMLHGIVSKTDTLLEKKDDILAKACGGLSLFKNARVLVLTFELVCIFSAAMAFITAAAVELHRNGFSSAWIGMLTTPSGLMQCLLSQWAGRLAGSAQNRERILLYTPILLGLSLLIIGALAKSMEYLATASSLISTTSTLLVPILSTLVVSSAALGAADVPWQRCAVELCRAYRNSYDMINNKHPRFLVFSCPNPWTSSM